MTALCPNCAEAEGEITARNVSENGVFRSYECPNCGYEWQMVF